jgi:hypothetical protein
MPAGAAGNFQLLVLCMPEDSYYEIDEPTDWLVVEKLLTARSQKAEIKFCQSL